MPLQRCELQVAERAPFAAVEVDKDRTIGEEGFAGYMLAKGIRQGELGERRANLDRSFWGGCQL